MASVGDHEPIEELSDETRDMHRAMVLDGIRRHDYARLNRQRGALR